MQLSLNELEAETKKAVRGAGLSWGVAEETSHATAWLARNGVDALPSLLDLLVQVNLSDDSALKARQAIAGEEQGNSSLCPVALGMAIVDRAQLLAGGKVLAFGPILRPVFLLPFLAWTARIIARPMIVNFGMGDGMVGPSRLHGTGLTSISDVSVASSFRCNASAAIIPSTEQPATSPRPVVNPEIWQRLQLFARRTYVPASEQSRVLGAGAGVIDND